MIKISRSHRAAILLAGILSLATSAFAGSTTTQTVTFEVSAINELSVSASTVSLQVNAATAGTGPTAVTNASTTYAVTTNETNRKITGAINTNMPTGVTLSVTLAAPTGASSAGKQALSTTATDLVTGIGTLMDPAKTITYELGATAAAGVVSSATKTVTLTVTAGS